MVVRFVGPRSFFRGVVGAACLLGGGCATTDGVEPDAAAQGVARAERWRSEGFSSLAARQFEESARLAAEQEDSSLEVTCLVDAAECWLLDRRPDVAEVALTRAKRPLSALPPASSRVRVAELRLFSASGDVAAVSGRTAEARQRYDAAMERAIGRERDLVAMRLALLAERSGDVRRARELVAGLANPADPQLAELRRMLLPFGPPAETTRRAPRDVAPPKVSRSDVFVAGAPPILPRTAWGARRAQPNLDRMTSIWRITVHHTATRLAGSSVRVAADAMRRFQREHQDDKGWADIGYHFIVDPSGRIWEGRPLAWQGAHAGSPGLNEGNVGVALIGDFTIQQPTASQKKALGDLLGSLCARYGIAANRVYSHQEIRPGPTECPGPALQRVLDQWRRGATATY